MVSTQATYATFCDDSFVPGVLNLAATLQMVRARYPLLVLHHADFSQAARDVLVRMDNVRLAEVGLVRNPNALAKPRFRLVYSKLNVFGLFDFERVVFLDADTVVLRNVDDLFELGVDFAAAPDDGMTLNSSKFNSGVFLCRPKSQVFDRMMEAVGVVRSPDGGDQGFLNEFLGDGWLRLSTSYNRLKRVFWHHPHQFALEDVRILHYVGAKPWHDPPSDFTRYRTLYELWWKTFPFDVYPIRPYLPPLRVRALATAHDAVRHLHCQTRRYFAGKSLGVA